MRIKPKKSLGQNFLIDRNIQRKIIRACKLKISDTILEIGAGTGELSGLISPCVKNLYALEKDTRLYKILQENIESYKNARIINRDILKFNLKRYFSGLGRNNKIKVIGNIPYYITSPIIEHLFKYKERIEAILITVQKEFAKRIVAPCGRKDYGAFSCFLQYYTKPEILFYIKKGSFSPSPKVDSCFLRLNLRSRPEVKLKSEKLFFKIIRQAFGQRRKTLRNSLKGIVTPEKIEEFFHKYRANKDIRPENLTLQDFANLSNL